MKPLLFLFISLLTVINSNAQDSLQKKKRIDSIINEQEKNVFFVNQSTKLPSKRLEQLHGRPHTWIRVFEYSHWDTPFKYSSIALADTDTSLLAIYYFNAGKLIKVKNTSYDLWSKKKEYEWIVYFDEGEAILTETLNNVPLTFNPKVYVKWAATILKQIKIVNKKLRGLPNK